MANPLYDALFAPHRGTGRDFLTWQGEGLSHDAFLDQAGRVAALLRDLGLAPGDRLVVQAGKSPTALALYAGAVQAGVVYLPLNTAYTASEVAYFTGDCGASLLVCDLGSEAALAPTLLTLSEDGASGSLVDRLGEMEPSTLVTPRSEDDLAALLYTSGTTGRSKGAMLTQGCLLANTRTLAALWGFTDADVLLHALPVYHTHGLFVATNIALLTGARLIFLPKFDLEAVLDALPRATAMMGVPTFYTRLLGDDRFGPAVTGNMRLFISGSAPLLAETHVAFEERTGHRILERYGMTEINMATSNPLDGERRAGTVGLPLPDTEVRVCDGAGKTLPAGEVGVLEVRGPGVFKGYWNMPEKTAAEFREGGFFITGDLARQSEDGYVTIVGREKDLIITGGLNVYPKEVEDVLNDLPGVVESAVIGVAHADMGEGVVAVLVTGPGFDQGAAEAAVAERLASFKRPRHWAVLPELPRNTMGKVQKVRLREDYAGVFSD